MADAAGVMALWLGREKKAWLTLGIDCRPISHPLGVSGGLNLAVTWNGKWAIKPIQRYEQKNDFFLSKIFSNDPDCRFTPFCGPRLVSVSPSLPKRT
jgi:hypothetical protein